MTASGGHTHPTPQQFVSNFVPRINELRPYATKFEMHNEPNHYQGYEGWGNSDSDAQDFRLWYLACSAGRAGLPVGALRLSGAGAQLSAP